MIKCFNRLLATCLVFPQHYNIARKILTVDDSVLVNRVFYAFEFITYCKLQMYMVKKGQFEIYRKGALLNLYNLHFNS